jgi:hypothetical protein
LQELDVLKEDSGHTPPFQAENRSGQQIATQQIEKVDPIEKKIEAEIMHNYFKLDALFANLHGPVYPNFCCKVYYANSMQVSMFEYFSVNILC